MIDVTDRHFRMLIRCISPLPIVYTEMTWDRAILYNAPGEPEHDKHQNAADHRSLEALLGFSEAEHPIVLQLGGSDPESLARAARIGAIRGYDEINLNCGCPAQTKGRSKNIFGARLMKEPERVAACCAAMAEAVARAAAAGELGSSPPPPITVKCRLGVDNVDSYEELVGFIRTVSSSGVAHFIVHARKALLNITTMQNRSVPPLRRDWVSQLMADFPHLTFTLNGGVGGNQRIGCLEEAHGLLNADRFHGVMIGRKANTDPYLFARCGLLYNGEAGPSRREVLESYLAYAAGAQRSNFHEWDLAGPRMEQNTRELLTPLTGLFHNTSAGPKWRQALTNVMKNKPLLREPVESTLRAVIVEVGLTDALLDHRPSLELSKHPPSTQAPISLVEPSKRAEGGAAGLCESRKVNGGKGELHEHQQQDKETVRHSSGGSRAGFSSFAAAAASPEMDANDGEAECCAPAVRRRDGRGEAEMEALWLEEERGALRRRVAMSALVAAAALGGAALLLMSGRRRSGQ
jgi:tRNA-dihydrouridine synthase A